MIAVSHMAAMSGFTQEKRGYICLLVIAVSSCSSEEPGEEKRQAAGSLILRMTRCKKVFQNPFRASLRGRGVSVSFEIDPEHPLQASL